MELFEEIRALCAGVAKAAPSLAEAGTKEKNTALLNIAEALVANSDKIIEANKADLASAEKNGVAPHMIDRLALDEKRIKGIADALTELVAQTDPIGAGETWTRPSGITIRAVRVPLGVIGIIFEARPNVTVDAAALCIKTGNATVLRGGKEAINTNIALVSLMKNALSAAGLDPNCVGLIEDTSHEGANILMQMTEYVDVLIPRGSRRLIGAVKAKSKIPVIETGAGNCHLYIDESADLDMAVKIAVNAKCSRPAVCNAIETLLVHEKIADKVLPLIADAMKWYGVEFRCDERSKPYVDGAHEAEEEDFSTEYDDYILAVGVVSGVDEAIEHINKYSTKHSEAIVTRSYENAKKFQSRIDSAAVYVNASTRFTDGGEFGFGAEIGISTQKLHARGPMGLRALTTEKYLIDGNGEIR
ncbi:MAG: glutamate-5-semialdehyde dehydrogenase [Ruminococcaceae bacterium]|nr:glutamate-5-semialdehyde dehydrogenase [Oscillospiraceae bacterium]